MRPLIATGLVTFLALGHAPAAQAYTAINGLTVNPVPGGFEVVARGGDGPRQIWCAAGAYVRATQGQAANPRIYVMSPMGPSQTRPGWRGVQFTTQPSADLAAGPRTGDGGNYSVRIKTPGFSLSTGHAEGFCSDVWEEITERWPLN